eukprot:410012-Prymnesium_polylepis.1
MSRTATCFAHLLGRWRARFARMSDGAAGFRRVARTEFARMSARRPGSVGSVCSASRWDAQWIWE